MEELIVKIRLDLEINKRCLNEDIPDSVRNIMDLWIKYDLELLSLIKKIQIESKRDEIK